MYSLLLVLITIVAHGCMAEPLCPSPDEIAPCTCFKSKKFNLVTALCENFSTASDISDIFNKNPNWNLQEVHIDHCTMSFVPAVMLERARFQNLNISNSVLDTLFDEAPKRTPELNVFLHNLRLLRGFEWKLFSNSSLKDFGAFKTQILSFGNSFKDNMPHDVQRIIFESTDTRRINAQAFENLKDLSYLAVRKSMLKSLSRNMFPNPWEQMAYLDFSFNKIMTLPEDIFEGMPKLGIFLFERNLLTTLSEHIFSKRRLYGLRDNPIYCNCNIKWITTLHESQLILIEGYCARPDALKGRQLKKLTKNDFAHCI